MAAILDFLKTYNFLELGPNAAENEYYYTCHFVDSRKKKLAHVTQEDLAGIAMIGRADFVE